MGLARAARELFDHRLVGRARARAELPRRVVALGDVPGAADHVGEQTRRRSDKQQHLENARRASFSDQVI